MWQFIIDIATIIAALAAAISVFYLAEQIKTSIEQEKIKRSCDFITRFTSPDFRVILSSLHFFADENISDSDRWKRLYTKDDPDIELRVKLAFAVNFFESMAMLYNKNLIDRKLTKHFFGKISLYYYELVKNFVKKAKENNRALDNICEDWDKMYNEFLNEKEDV